MVGLIPPSFCSRTRGCNCQNFTSFCEGAAPKSRHQKRNVQRQLLFLGCRQVALPIQSISPCVCEDFFNPAGITPFNTLSSLIFLSTTQPPDKKKVHLRLVPGLVSVEFKAGGTSGFQAKVARWKGELLRRLLHLLEAASPFQALVLVSCNEKKTSRGQGWEPPEVQVEFWHGGSWQLLEAPRRLQRQLARHFLNRSWQG